MARKSYGHFCGLARSLDVVGDRWSLLIVRELLIGPARFGELRSGLPTVATNLLTSRLKDLEEQGVIERQLATDTNAIVYTLTPWGRQLKEPIDALIRWSTPLMVVGRRNDAFDPRWLVPALAALLTDRRSPSPVALVLLVDGNPIQITIANDGPRVELLEEVPAGTQAVLRTTPETALALAAKALTPEQAISSGRSYTSSPETVCAVLG